MHIILRQKLLQHLNRFCILRRRVCTSSLPYRISIHNQQLVFSRIVIIWQDSKTSDFLRQVTVIHWQRRFQGLWCDKLPLCKLCNSKYFKNRFEFFRTRTWVDIASLFRSPIQIPDPMTHDPRSDRFTFESHMISIQFNSNAWRKAFIDSSSIKWHRLAATAINPSSDSIVYHLILAYSHFCNERTPVGRKIFKRFWSSSRFSRDSS